MYIIRKVSRKTECSYEKERIARNLKFIFFSKNTDVYHVIKNIINTAIFSCCRIYFLTDVFIYLKRFDIQIANNCVYNNTEFSVTLKTEIFAGTNFHGKHFSDSKVQRLNFAEFILMIRSFIVNFAEFIFVMNRFQKSQKNIIMK